MILDGTQLHSFEQQLQSQLQELILAHRPDQKFCVGLSGGADSTALLVAACQVLGPANVRALHGNHRLHPQAPEWVEHCERLCEQLGVELVVGSLDLVPGNVEAAARQARYDFFAGQLQADETLLLGHHSQDQLETVFMRLFQGRSLLPMRGSGPLGEADFLRPLLAFTRQQVLDYLQQQGLAWIEDPSNRDEALTRNFLRHRVMPLLMQRWPSLGQAVQRVTTWQQGQNALLHELLQEYDDQVSFAELPKSEVGQRAWLRIFLELRGHFKITDKALNEFCRQSQQGAVSRLDLAANCALMGWRNHFYYEADTSVYTRAAEALPVPLEAGETIEFGDQHWTLKNVAPGHKGGFYSLGKLYLSTRRKGLTMRWRGRQADIKEVFRDLDVPPWRRQALPLLIWQNEVVAVSTDVISERFRDYPTNAVAADYYRLLTVK